MFSLVLLSKNKLIIKNNTVNVKEFKSNII